jgi:ligand-binding SRPBCC domain-containing protein
VNVHLLERSQRIERPVEDVFEFFADARNLESITPAWLHFRIVTPGRIEMRPGALIEYRLRLHGLPLRWLTRIEEWEPGRRFVDVQVRGPYRLWHHSHEFEAEGANATLVRDRVKYLVGASDPLPDAVVLDFGANADLDITSAETLEQLVDALEAAGIDLALADLRQPVIARLQRTGLTATLGEDRIFPTLDEAVAALSSRRARAHTRES